MGTVVSESGPWSLGTLIWLPIALVLVVGLYLIGRSAWKHRKTVEHGTAVGEMTLFSVVAFILSAAFAIGTALGMWPYDSEFHQWRPVTGKVQAVSDRLVPAGKGMEQRFVLVIDGQPFAVDDTRAALVKPGDVVALSCKREWQYAALSGWGCRWGDAR